MGLYTESDFGAVRTTFEDVLTGLYTEPYFGAVRTTLEDVPSLYTESDNL